MLGYLPVMTAVFALFAWLQLFDLALLLRWQELFEYCSFFLAVTRMADFI